MFTKDANGNIIQITKPDMFKKIEKIDKKIDTDIKEDFNYSKNSKNIGGKGGLYNGPETSNWFKKNWWILVIISVCLVCVISYGIYKNKNKI
jgi:hypothetical protein